ncbi:MAG: helix-turn-helix domain-containing protein [Planctomycetota bacterium]
MALGKRLLLFSVRDPKAAALHATTADWGCLATTCESLDELRGRLEGAEHDMVLIESSAVLRKMLQDGNEDEVLQLPLAEVEKRHILRVLASTGGNKTRAARILGIDTKTLYNKLKSYKSSELVARKRIAANGALHGSY